MEAASSHIVMPNTIFWKRPTASTLLIMAAALPKNVNRPARIQPASGRVGVWKGGAEAMTFALTPRALQYHFLNGSDAEAPKYSILALWRARTSVQARGGGGWWEGVVHSASGGAGIVPVAVTRARISPRLTAEPCFTLPPAQPMHTEKDHRVVKNTWQVRASMRSTGDREAGTAHHNDKLAFSASRHTPTRARAQNTRTKHSHVPRRAYSRTRGACHPTHMHRTRGAHSRMPGQHEKWTHRARRWVQ